MRFTQAFAIIGLSASLAAAQPVPPKRALVAPFSNGAGDGLLEDVGKTVDAVFTGTGTTALQDLRGGQTTQTEDNSNNKRALVAPFSNGAGDGLLEDVGEVVDGVFIGAGTTVGQGLRGGTVTQPEDNTKRALVAPFSDGAGDGLIEDVGKTVDGVFIAGGTTVGEGLRGSS